MVRCVISGCRSDSHFAARNTISFHRLPKNELRQHWELFLKYNEKKPVAKIPKICTLHFEADYVQEHKNETVTLKPNAIPTIIYLEERPVVVQPQIETAPKNSAVSMCRICLTDGKVSIFEDNDLHKMIEICTDVKMSQNDGFPETICNECVEKVLAAYKLRVQTKQTDEILRDVLKSSNQNKSADDSEPETSRDEGIVTDEVTETLVIRDEPTVQKSFEAVATVQPQNLVEIKIEAEEQPPTQTNFEQPVEIKTEVEDQQSLNPLEQVASVSIESSDIKLEPDDQPAEASVKIENEPIRDEVSVLVTPKPELTDIIEQISQSAGVSCPQKAKKRKAKTIKCQAVFGKKISDRIFCHICGKTNLPNGHSLTQHIKLRHSSQTFPCDLCPKVYVSVHRLKAHKRFSHELKINYKCDQCPRTYISPKPLQIHKLEAHFDGPLKYKCSICDRKFGHPDVAEYHVKMHVYNSTDGKLKRPEGSTKPKCMACKIFHFNSRTEFRKHVKEHANHYRCDKCYKVFASDLRLRAHLKLTHRSEELACGKCKFETKYPQVIKRHMKTHEEV